ncbi:MAG: CooT family nickel-binding protein [Desulfatiglandaceae bacterium]
MCEAHAYMMRQGEEEKILESVDLVEVDGDAVRLVNIFGEQKSLTARLRRYDSTEGKIVFESV